MRVSGKRGRFFLGSTGCQPVVRGSLLRTSALRDSLDDHI
jgi:hypothetical protein